MALIGPLPYTPLHLDDETLYSYLGRVNAYNCAGCSRRFLQRVFGTSKAVSSADLPTSLGTMLDGWSDVSPYPSVDEVIEKATQYPYHRPFMPVQRWEELVSRATTGPGHSLKTWLGLVAQRFAATATFRSCVACDQAAWDTDGALYWHRAHLLPGVVICPIHLSPLIEHFVQSRDSSRSGLRMRPEVGRPIRVPQPALGCLTRFAVTSFEALPSAPLELTGDVLTSIYLARLEQMGLRGAGKIRWRELSSLLMQSNHAFEGMEVGERITRSTDGVLRWPHELLRGRHRLSHPLTHILLINSLFGSLAECGLAMSSNEPGRIAAPPEQPDISRPVVQDVTMSCRAAALNLGVSVTTVVQRRRMLGLRIAERRKSLTPARLAEVTSMLRSGVSVAKVALTTHLSFSSVYRIRATIALPLTRYAAKSRSDLTTTFRCRWLATEGCGRTVRERRVLDGAAYAWLYRNDREWLTRGRGHTPSSPVQKAHRPRVDWDKRDENYAKRLAAVSTNLKDTSRRKRTSPSELIRATAPESSVRANLHRLPRFRAALEACAESTLAFQHVRFARAAASLSDQDGFFPQWKALRVAGLHRLPGGDPPRANMSCYTYPREISEQRGRYDDQSTTQGRDGRSEQFARSGRIGRSP